MFNLNYSFSTSVFSAVFPAAHSQRKHVKTNHRSSWAVCYLLVYTFLSLKTTGWHTSMTPLLYWCVLSAVLQRCFKKIISLCMSFSSFYLCFFNIIGSGLCISPVNPFLCLSAVLGGSEHWLTSGLTSLLSMMTFSLPAWQSPGPFMVWGWMERKCLWSPMVSRVGRRRSLAKEEPPGVIMNCGGNRLAWELPGQGFKEKQP